LKAKSTKPGWGIGSLQLTRNRLLAWVVALLGAGVLAAIVVPPLLAPQGAHQAGPAGLAGQRAPVFDLRDDAGVPVSLARYRGSIVVMNLWASWCPPCRAEMPELQRFADAHRAGGIVVVGVNQGESAARARAFAQALQIRFPVWLDELQQYGRAFTALGLPTTVVIDRNGIVTHGFDGAVTFGEVSAAVTAAQTGTSRP
jgi:peroxiredoxin